MTWDIENFLEHLSGNDDVETNDNSVSFVLIPTDRTTVNWRSIRPLIRPVQFCPPPRDNR